MDQLYPCTVTASFLILQTPNKRSLNTHEWRSQEPEFQQREHGPWCSAALSAALLPCQQRTLRCSQEPSEAGNAVDVTSSASGLIDLSGDRVTCA